LLFIVLDALFRKRQPPMSEEDLARLMEADARLAAVPERVVRHPLPSRLFHWVMAISMFGLLGTAFLPILGVQFSWVTAHWSFGLLLTGCVLFHIVHSVFWMDLKSMWITRQEVKE